MSKLIYAPSASALEAQYRDELHSVFQNLQSNYIYRSIAFTGDGFMYTHGKKFRLFLVDPVYGMEGLSFTINNGVASLNIDGVSLGNGNVITNITGDDALTPTNTNGVVSIVHTPHFNAQQELTRGNNLENVAIPQLTIDTYGHISAASSSNVNVTLIKAAAIDGVNNNNYYLVGVTDTNTQTPYYNSNIYIDNSGNLKATALYEGNDSLVSKYAGIGHISIYATDQTYGHVKLSDAADEQYDKELHYAATPKALALTLTAANTYTENLIAALDAMVFAGTINPTTGVIVSHNENLFSATDGVTTIQDLVSYSVGYTFRCASAGTFGTEDVEVGDMIIAIRDKDLNFSASDFTIIQTNINGAITTTSDITDSIIYGTGATSVGTVPFTEGVLTCDNNNILGFVNKNTLWRTITVNNNSINTDTLNLSTDSYLSYSSNSTNGVSTVQLSVNTNSLFSAAGSLTFKEGNTEVSYIPNSSVSIYIGGGLVIGEKEVNNTKYKEILQEAITNNGISGFGTITVDKYGRVTNINTITSLPNAYPFCISDNSGSTLLSYNGGDNSETLQIVNANDLTFSFAYNLENHVLSLTPSVTHYYRPISFSNGGQNATTVLNTNDVGAFTLLGGNHITLRNTGDNNRALTSGYLAIDATWRNVNAYGLDGNNIWSIISLGDNTLQFDESLMLDSHGIGLYWVEIDEQGLEHYEK